MTTPTFVELDPAVIFNEVLSDYTTITGLTPQQGQPEYSLLESIAYREVLLRNRINETGKAVLLDFANAPVLDYLAASFGIVRLEAQPAVCTILFTLVNGHNALTIPKGTRIKSTTNVIFETTDDVFVLNTTNSVSIVCQCQTAGLTGNGFEIGDVNIIQDPLAYLTSASNTDATQGGIDGETDEQLRSRTKLATSIFSVAGSRNAYIYWAKTASPLISDIKLLTYQDDNTIDPGIVRIFALLEGGEPATSAVNTLIEDVLSSETIRPLTDIVEVVTPTAKNYSLTVDVTKYPTAVNADLISQLSTILTAYGTAQKQSLGIDVVCSQIEGLCRISGIYDVSVTIVPASGSLTGRNYIIDTKSVAIQTGFTITVTGSNNG